MAMAQVAGLKPVELLAGDIELRLAENEDEESSVLAEVEDRGNSMAAGVGSASSGAPAAKPAARAPRWP